MASDQHESRHAKLRDLQRRIEDDVDELENCGVSVLTHGPAEAFGEPGDAVLVEVAASSEDAARRVMMQRYGDKVRVVWLGEAPIAEEAVPWTAYELVNERELLVKYTAVLGCQPARAVVEETTTEVKVTVYEQCPVQGPKPYTPTARSATVRLSSPLAGRRIVDGARYAQ